MIFAPKVLPPVQRPTKTTQAGAVGYGVVSARGSLYRVRSYNKIKSVQESRIYAFATHLMGIIAKIQPFVKRKVIETTGTKNQFYALFMLANG